jgi:hypothetical protein
MACVDIDSMAMKPSGWQSMACEDIRLVSAAIDNRLPWNTQLCRYSQSFTQRYEVTPVTGSSSLSLGDDEVK